MSRKDIQRKAQALPHAPIILAVCQKGMKALLPGGILSYEIANSAEKVDIKISVQYDESLWNKQAGADITGDATAITVKMTAGR